MLNILRGQDEQNDGASLLMEIITFIFLSTKAKTEESWGEGEAWIQITVEIDCFAEIHEHSKVRDFLSARTRVEINWKNQEKASYAFNYLWLFNFFFARKDNFSCVFMEI